MQCICGYKNDSNDFDDNKEKFIEISGQYFVKLEFGCRSEICEIKLYICPKCNIVQADI